MRKSTASCGPGCSNTHRRSAPSNLPPLYLGFGLSDRFASNHQLLADALPAGHVFTTEGGHDWPQWSQLWRKMLDVLPLPSRSRNAR